MHRTTSFPLHLLVLAAAVVAVAIAFQAPPVEAATVPSGFTDTPVVTGLDNPTAMALAPDGRIFITEKGGDLRVVKNGALLSQPFVSVTVNQSGERGLLGVAIDPDFTNNKFVYVYYTSTEGSIHNRVSRFTAAGDVAAAGSELPLLDMPALGATNHNGGAIHFGPDGKLYIAVGENAVGSNSQSLANVLGKVLRINKDGSIPADNPFVGTSGARTEIWALGLRNPFTFAFQPGTGRVFINDVGEGSWEEINDGAAGANYGWPEEEGVAGNPSFVDPVFAYGHGSGATTGCSIAGGAFYNPTVAQFPSDYAGDYFFADYCSGWIRRYDPGTDSATAFATGLDNPVDLMVAPDGSLYYLEYDGGILGRITYSAGTAPAAPALVRGVAVSTSQIQVQWDDNSNNETGFIVLRLDGGAWVQIGNAGANVESFTDSGRSPGVLYAYWLVAYNGSGSAAAPASLTAMTQTASPIPPAMVSVAALSSSTMSIKWSDKSNNEAGFRVYRFQGSDWLEIGNVGAGTTTFQDTGLSTGATYFYWVAAYNSAGISYAPFALASHTFTGPTEPTAPVVTSATQSGNTSLQINWQDNTTNELGFRVYRLIGSTWTLITTTAPNATSYTESGLSPGTRYFYWVIAFGSGFVAPGQASVGAITGANLPTAPTVESAVGISSSQMRITWRDRSNNETGFRVFRWVGSAWQEIAVLSPNTTAYTDSGLSPFTTYWYWVHAIGSSGDTWLPLPIFGVTTQ